MLSPAASSFARASPTSTPASRETIATFASPSAAASASPPLRLGSGGRPDDAPDSRVQLLVGRRDVDHQIAERLSEADHGDRRKHVQNQLLRRSRLEARRAGQKLRADDHDDGVIHERLQRRLGRGDDAGRRRTGRDRSLDCAQHVRRSSAGADADDDVVPSDLERGQSAAPPSRSSSAASWSRGVALSPPARSETTLPGGTEKVDSHSDASSAAILPEDPAPT